MVIGGVATLLIVLAAAVLPIAGLQWPPARGLLVVEQTLAALAYLLTAHLLVRHFLASRMPSLLWVAAGTLYAAGIQLVQLWVLPDLPLADLPPDRAILMAASCWLFWHVGLPIAAIGFAWSERRPPQSPCAVNQTRILLWGMRATVAALVAISAVVILSGPWASPALVAGEDYRRAGGVGVGVMLAAEGLVTLVLLWRWTRLRTGFQLCLGLAILALTLDDVLTLAGGMRGTLGWYAGRAEALAAVGCLLSLCLGEVDRLYRSVSRAIEERWHAEWAFETELARRTRVIAQALTAAEQARDAQATALADKSAEHAAALDALSQQQGEIETLRAQAEAAAVAKAQFLSTMSHELRTPLTGVIGFSDLLLRTEQSPADQRRFLEMQREAAHALLAVVADVLDYAHAEAGRLELETAPFAPRALIEEAASVVRHGIRAKGLEFRVAVAPSVPSGLAGDAARIRQILLNLLSNAVKFTPGGSIELRVDYQTRTEGPSLFCMQVIDTGIGIAADKFDRLFQHFSQVDGSRARRYGGSGLGLAICRKLVELMGGELGVESEEGRGSLFWVELPLAIAAVPQALAPDARHPPRRILLAEDVVANQILVTALLEAHGHLVDVVNDGVAAVMALRRTAYDLVLMDLQMPVLNGLEATRAIRDDEGAQRHTPIVALSANATAEDTARCLAAGMDACVGKPIDEPHLLATIDRLTASAASSSRPLVAVLDEVALDGLIARLGVAKATELVTLFRRSVETEAAALELARADAATARGHARALAGLAGNLGCAELERAARRLGCLRDSAERDEFDQHLQALGQAVDRALDALAARFPAGAEARIVPLPARRS